VRHVLASHHGLPPASLRETTQVLDRSAGEATSFPPSGHVAVVAVFRPQSRRSGATHGVWPVLPLDCAQALENLRVSTRETTSRCPRTLQQGSAALERTHDEIYLLFPGSRVGSTADDEPHPEFRAPHSDSAGKRPACLDGTPVPQIRRRCASRISGLATSDS
jgi:hypothetical protein